MLETERVWCKLRCLIHQRFGTNNKKSKNGGIIGATYLTAIANEIKDFFVNTSSNLASDIPDSLLTFILPTYYILEKLPLIIEWCFNFLNTVSEATGVPPQMDILLRDDNHKAQSSLEISNCSNLMTSDASHIWKVSNVIAWHLTNQ